jgi:hypothetical protein
MPCTYAMNHDPVVLEDARSLLTLHLKTNFTTMSGTHNEARTIVSGSIDSYQVLCDQVGASQRELCDAKDGRRRNDGPGSK